MEGMEEHRFLPDTDRLSVLVAVILFIYAMTSFINLPEAQISVQIPGFFLAIPLNYRALVSLAVGVLAATGMNSILRSHPYYDGSNTFQHWLLPTMTAWVMGLTLSTLSDTPTWWLIFSVGGILLTLVFIAEYILMDPLDIFAPAASMGLIALAFTLFLILGIALKASGARLFLILPAVTISAVLITLRTLNLRTGKGWSYAWTIGIALTAAEIVAGLHYLPLTPIKYGLILTGSTFALNSLAVDYLSGSRGWKIAIEPGVFFIIFAGIATLVK